MTFISIWCRILSLGYVLLLCGISFYLIGLKNEVGGMLLAITAVVTVISTIISAVIHEAIGG